MGLLSTLFASWLCVVYVHLCLFLHYTAAQGDQLQRPIAGSPSPSPPPPMGFPLPRASWKIWGGGRWTRALCVLLAAYPAATVSSVTGNNNLHPGQSAVLVTFCYVRKLQEDGRFTQQQGSVAGNLGMPAVGVAPDTPTSPAFHRRLNV